MALTEKEKRALFGSYQTAIDQRNAGYSPNQTTLTLGAESYNELIRQEEAARKAAYDNRISNAQKFNDLAARYTSLVDRLNNAASRYGADYGKQRSNYQSINRSRNEFSGVSDEIEDMLAEIDASDLDDATKNEFATALIELGKATDSASLDARSRSAAYNNPATQRIMQQEDADAFAWSKYDDYERMLQTMPNRLATQALTTAPYDYQGLAPSVANAKMEAMPEGNAKEAVRTWLDSPTGKLITDSALGAEIERLKGISVDTAINSVQQTISDLDEKANEMKRYWDEQAYLNDNSGSAPDYAEYEKLLEERAKYESILDDLYNDKDSEEMSGYTWVDDSIVRSNLSENYNATNLYDRVNKAYFDTTVDFGVEYTPNRGVKTSSYPIAQRPENYMTQEERDTFNKLWHYKSEEAATAYFERLTPTLEARGAQQVMAEAKQFTEDYPNWAWVQARGANAMKPITSAFMIGDILSGNGINENSAANLNTSVANFVDSYVPQVTNYTGDAQILGRDLDQFLYGTVGSVIDSGVRTLTASFLSGGGSGATLRENIKGLSRATGALMSLEVFPTVVLQEKEKGRSDTEAVVLGTLRAAIEGLTEKYSIEMLFSPSRNFGTQLLKGAVAEGSEEIAATVLNGAVDIIAGDKDNIIAEFDRRVAMGINPSEALADILLERGKSTLVDGLSGALSGLLFTAGGGVGGAFNTTSKEANRVSESTESARILVEQALAENPNSKVALNAQKQLAAGKNISAKTVQKLINENESIYRQDDQQKVTEAVIKELTNRGEVTAVRETAAAIAKAVSGENLSDGELRSIEGSVFGTQIYNEITGKAEGGEWLNQLREDLDILKIAPQTKKQESRAKRVTVRNADATTKSGERVQILGLQAQDDGTVSVKVRGTNGAESVVAASELNMSEESQDLVEGVAEFKGAAPAVYAAYMPTNDISAYLNDAAFVVEAARGVVAENDGSSMLRYLKNSRHISELADIQIETIFNAALADGRKTLAEAQPLPTAGSGQFTYTAKRAESSLRGREAASTVFMQNLAKVAPNIDIEVFESIARNGKYIGEQGSYSNGKIRIDLNAGKNFTYEVAESAMIRTLSHELTHHLQRTAPKQYADLKAFVIKHLAEWNGGKELDDLISAKQRRAKGGLSYAAAMDEVVADACEMMLKNSKAIQQLATENKSLFAKIRDFVKKFLSDLRRAFAGVEATDAAAKYLQKFESEMQQLWDAAFMASVENSRMTSTAIPAANTLMNPMQETQFSLREDEKFMQNAINANKAKQLVPYRVMAAAQDARSAIAAIMRDPKLQDALNLPADLMGKTYFPDGAYNGTEENTLVCPRSMGAEELLDAVSEMIGRPLTVDECIEVSQFIAGSEFKPECEYCYVATDRKAYRAFLKSYVEQRDSVIEKYKGGMSKAALYEEFLDGRKDTKNMRDRFNLWIKIVDQNLPMMQASDLANVNKLMHDIIEPGIRDQVKDAMKYAQSASWAKKRVGYTAYNGHILKWSQTKINQLNKGFGLRMYSFSDFSPAFILENMQMITDAAVRGLKMMAYTKEADFVKIFAPTGININVSTFGFERNGVVAENAMQGVSWKEAQELRAKYPNVGITFVATNDNLVNWALEQDWIDVVIPYHLVRTGKQVAERLGFTNYTSESGDIKASDWTKGRDLSSIPPTMHNNDKQTYLDALEANHLQPRFKRWIDHPNYMKLVNETRLSSLESNPVQPKFDLESAKKSLIGMIKDGGYFQHIGGSVDRMYEIASGIAETFDDGTQFSERGQKNNAQEGDVLGTMYSNRDVLSWNIAWDSDNFSSLKSQMDAHMSEINEMNPVTDVVFEKKSGNTYANILDDVLKKKFGYKIERADKATFLFDKTAIATLRRYVTRDEEAAAIISTPYVLKRGKAISGHRNHKEQGYPSVTYAAPVSINGETVNVAVAVLFGDKNRPHSMRVLMPSGNEFVIGKEKANPGREAASRKTDVGSPTGSASNKKVPQSTAQSQVQKSDRDYEAAEIARLEQRIEALEQGKSDAFLAGQMRTARQAGKETRRLTEKIDTLKGKLDAAKQTATDTRKATAAERKAADLRAKNLEAQIKKLTKEAEAIGFLAGEMRVARQAGAEIRNREEQIRKLKEELAEKKAAYEQNIEKFREGRDVKTYRDRVMKRVRDLQDMLITNSDKKHIPEMLKEPLGNFLMSLDTSSATKLKGKGETKADADMYRRTELLKQALERARNNTDSGSYLDLPDEFMERIEELSGMIHEITGGVDAVADSPINLMNSSQLKDLNFVLRTLQHSINSMNKMLATARFQTVAQAAESTITELDQILEYQMKGKGAEALRGTINWKNTTPVYAFDRMGEAGKELFKAMWEAQGEFAFHTKEILETREGFVSDKQVRKWSQDVQTIQLSDNRSIRMTTAQMMAFYCLTKRQQALDHLKTGGIRISNIEYGRNHIQQARAYHLSADDIVKIANMVKGDAKRVADQLQQYMTERGSEWGNQISMARFGYRAFTEPVYFPIRTESSQIAKDTKSTQENSINRLLNMSFTKSTQPNASTSVVVDNIFDVFSAHMSDMAKYNAFALPVLDMIKWFDYNVQERLEDGVQKDHRAVKTSIESAYGKDALNYISTFLEDVNGANEGGRVRSASLSQKFISHYKASAVGANLRVAIQQPTSYWRAAAVLSPKYLAVGEKVMWHNAKKYYKEMSKYAGIATWKELGFRDFNVGRSVREQIAGTLSASAQAYDKVMDASMKLAALGDTWTWCRIWEACKAEVKATLKLSGEELMHATAERFNEVIARTQVVDSVMTRSHTMRSKNLLDQLMTPFMAEPTLSYNVVASSVFDYRTELRRSNGQVAWKKYGKKMIRAFGVFAVTAFWTGVFQSLADALRDDDDYEEFYKKFLDAMLPKGLPKWNFNEDPMKWIEEALDQGNFLANMNIASNIPGLHRELLNVLKGFGSEAMWTAGISNFYNAVAAVYEKIALEAGWMEEATDATWNGNMTWWGAIQKSLQSASQISSLPIYNLLRDATALYNTTVQEFFGRQDIKLLSYDPGTEGRVANAYADGFLTFDEAMGEMLKFGVSQDKAYETLMKSAGFGKYDELREAIVNGGDVNAVMEKLTGYGIKEDLVTNNVKAIIKDLVLGTEDEPPMIDKKTAKNLLIQYLGMTVPEAHYTVEAYGEENFSKYDDLRDAILNDGDVQAAMDELTEYGTKEADVLSEIRASIKVWYQGETKDDGTVVDPVIDKDRAVELLVQYGDRDEDEATELVTEWSLTVDTGVKDIKESFIAGDLTTDEAIDYRMTYYGQSEEDAAQTVAEWIFEDEYGFSYNDRIGQFKDGNLSADELVDVMVEYGGKTDAEAKASVAGYAKEAYADGQFTRDEALSVMTNSGGMTSDEADKRLRYIDVSAQFPDITVDDAWVNEYYEEVESSGISINVFIEYRNNVKDISGEGKKARRMDVINSMPISNAQKDALYYAEGWAASTIHEAPWR